MINRARRNLKARLLLMMSGYIFIEFVLVFCANAFEVERFNAQSEMATTEKTPDSQTEQGSSGGYAVPNGFRLSGADKDYNYLSDLSPNQKQNNKKRPSAVETNTDGSSGFSSSHMWEKLKEFFRKINSMF